ncbi:hypothetical protein F5884DRAFT_827604 [Xylogone sp. PMI_703]|nr:hypothetical protein F5884DRAFT_827604 [Xylogone sp. PMI_703]
MKNVISLISCVALANALPTSLKQRDSASVTFNGAAGAGYTIDVPLDGTPTATNNGLSISSITSSIDIATQCTLSTVDYPPELVEGPPGTWVVGPPQTVNSISCTGGSAPPAGSITIEFDGAADAKYTLTVPLDGTFTPTNNVLSISTLVSTYANLPSCTFQYVDGSATLVNIAPDTWAVGPPQTITGVSC